jgi:hypothetical protein
MLTGVLGEELLLPHVGHGDIFIDVDLFPLAALGGSFDSPLTEQETFLDQDAIGSVLVHVGGYVLLQTVVDTDSIPAFVSQLSGVPIAPLIVIDGDKFYAPIATGRTLAPLLFATDDSVDSPTINRGIAIATVVDADIVNPQIIDLGNVRHLLSSAVTSDDAITTDAIGTAISFGLLADVDAFYVPARINRVLPAILVDGETFRIPLIATPLAPSAFNDGEVIYLLDTIQPGTLHAPLVVDGEIFPTTFLPIVFTAGLWVETDTIAAISIGAGIGPSFITDAESFYTAIILSGAATLLPTAVPSADVIFAPRVTTGQIFTTSGIFSTGAGRSIVVLPPSTFSFTTM